MNTDREGSKVRLKEFGMGSQFGTGNMTEFCSGKMAPKEVGTSLRTYEDLD